MHEKQTFNESKCIRNSKRINEKCTIWASVHLLPLANAHLTSLLSKKDDRQLNDQHLTTGCFITCEENPYFIFRFDVSRRLLRFVSRFTVKKERLTTIRIGGNFHYIILVCAYCPIEDKSDVVGNVVYAKLEEAYDKLMAYHA